MQKANSTGSEATWPRTARTATWIMSGCTGLFASSFIFYAAFLSGIIL